MEHEFDGIREYDNCLPNWWMMTFYGAILFAIVYWFAIYMTKSTPIDYQRLQVEMNRIAAIRLASSADSLSDEQIWKMVENPDVLASGQKVYQEICITCHGANLEGGIGLPLIKNQWVHGGHPTDLLKILNNGVLEKGMPAWGPIIGPKKSIEVIAFILSKNDKDTLQAAYPNQVKVEEAPSPQ